MNRDKLLLSKDKKNIKMIFNRVKGYASQIAGEILKNKCYFKQKLKIRSNIEQKLKMLGDTKF